MTARRRIEGGCGRHTGYEPTQSASDWQRTSETRRPPEFHMRAGMMTCKSCGSEISRKAETCPMCGHAYVSSYMARVRQWGCLWAVLAIIFVILALALTNGR